MQLATYIKDLLYRYECVIIPGFGAFLTQTRSAHINLENHTFYPPNKVISFNRQLQTNDGILANYMASVEGCSYELALQKIRNFTGKISLELAEGKTVSLHHIGNFALNTHQAVEFTPSEVENFNTSAFGLSSFVSQSIDRVVISEENERPVATLSQESKKTRIPVMRYAAVGLIAITLGGFSGLKIYENQIESHNFAERQKADSLVGVQIQEATFVISNPLPALNVVIEKEVGKYHIVAGAFKIEANAKKKLAQLSQKGFTPQMIGKNRYGLHQVVYSSHEDRLDALQTLRTIKRTENKDAWLLVQDLNL